MRLITRNSDYAVRVLCYIAKNKCEKISAAELVKKLKIPKPFLRKIMQTLQKKGFLTSCKGQGGGFSLAKRPEKIFITEVVAAFQGPLKLNECLFKSKLCPRRKKCKLKKKIDEIEKYVVGELSGITVASLLE